MNISHHLDDEAVICQLKRFSCVITLKLKTNEFITKLQLILLPMSNLGSKFKLTYLRAQEEFEALLPDLSVSSRVYFLSNFLVSENHFENYFFGLKNHVR